MTRGKKRSPEDIEQGLAALAEAGGNAEEASRKTGIPANTLREWKLQFRDEFGELRREKRSELIKEFWAAIGDGIRILRKKLPHMKGKELAITVGILVDKALVLGGEQADPSEGKVDDAARQLLAAIEREMAGPKSTEQDKATPESPE